MTRRRLTPDEVELWHKVVEQAERLHPERRTAGSQSPLPKPKPTKHPVPRLDKFSVGESVQSKPVKHHLKPTLSESLNSSPVQMDRKSFQRMKRGKLSPEGKLDLHGMRLNSAHPTLIRFILSAQASGKRLVLVITGKGKSKPDDGPIPAPRGVLRHQVPQWLAMPPLAQAVLQVSPAHVSHGGDGAFYVYLRRTR
ncbi:Smr/MutS family protein [Primorskyibacter sp. S87]|uniref:Smr/MutS family protein n=1 Tax=Primorskyibacter sp. S87 TaxID=3415126 RepID=UPI003C7E5ADF